MKVRKVSVSISCIENVISNRQFFLFFIFFDLSWKVFWKCWSFTVIAYFLCSRNHTLFLRQKQIQCYLFLFQEPHTVPHIETHNLLHK